MRKANAGESTVGVALQNFSNAHGTIQILISRRNQSLTVEKVTQAVADNIAAMNIKNQVDTIVSNASATLAAQLASSASDFASMQTQLADNQNVTNQLQVQIEQLTLQNQKYGAFDELIANISDIDNLIYRDSLGNLDLLGGKFEASEITAGMLTIKTVDLESPTIGSALIPAGNDNIIISTKAVASNSKIFVTPVDSSPRMIQKTIQRKDDTPIVIEIPITWSITDQLAGASFTVKTSGPVTEDMKFNWWIVQEK